MIENPLLVGGLLGGGLMALWGWVRRVGSSGTSWIFRRVVFEVTALEDDGPAFDHLLLAFSRLSNYKPWQVLLNEDRPTPDEEDGGLRYPVFRYLPGPGWHWAHYRGGIIVLRYKVNRQENVRRPSREVTLYQWRVPKDTAKELAEVGYRLSGEGDTLRVYQWSDRDWDLVRTTRRRGAQSIILENLTDIEEDVKAFVNARVWYRNMGIPHRRGLLFYGPPGNGKSTMGMYLAGMLKVDAYVINLSAVGMSDTSFAAALGEVPVGAVVIMEDIDAAMLNRDATAGKSLTFSGVLNALDGPTAADGRLLVITTNHPERLDPALIRPGRVDRMFELPNATQSQAERLFLRFFDNAPELAARFGELYGDGTHSMASLQERLLSSRNNPAAILEDV